MALTIVDKINKNEEKLLLAAAKEAFLFLGDDFEANLMFVSQDKICKLNSTYRGLNKVTDVLSFKLDEANGGDIVICTEIAKKNAQDWGMLETDLIQLLVIHGILHLAGFDHEKEVDRAKMESTEAIIMSKLGIILER